MNQGNLMSFVLGSVLFNESTTLSVVPAKGAYPSNMEVRWELDVVGGYLVGVQACRRGVGYELCALVTLGFDLNTPT